MTLQELFGVELPIIQAPMAGYQGSEMAIAVSNAGGLGSLPCAMLSLQAMQTELTAIRARTDKPFNVNFFCHPTPEIDAGREAAWRKLLRPYHEEFDIVLGEASTPSRTPFSAAAADVLAAFKPAVVSFHFGLPAADLVKRVKGWGSKVLSSATTVEEALWLSRSGVDAIIAQGFEAGGHRGIFLSEDLVHLRCYRRSCEQSVCRSSRPAASRTPKAWRRPWRSVPRVFSPERRTCCARKRQPARCIAPHCRAIVLHIRR